MTSRLILTAVFAISLVCCVHSQTLTIAFTRISSLEKGAKVYIGEQHIGYVIDIKPNKNTDTLFVSVNINKGIKIPKGSKFYLDENLLGPSNIKVEFSKDLAALTSNDISIGIFRPLEFMTPSQVDSAKLNMRKLRSPKVDTLRN